MQKNEEYKDIPLVISFIFTILVNLPQLWKTWNTKDVASFSTYTIVMRLCIHISFGIYGIMEADIIIIIMSVEVFCCELLLLVFKWMYSKVITDAQGVELVQDVPMDPPRKIICNGQTRNGLQVLVASV